MNEAAEVAMMAAQKLSGQTDRALFLLCLIVLMTFGIAVVRYLVKAGEKKSVLLVELFKEANEGRLEMAKVVQSNTDVMGETKEQLRENTEFLRRAVLRE